MPFQNRALAHAIIVEKTIGRLGVRPVLAGRRQALANRASHAIEQLAQATIEPSVRKRAPRQLSLEPFTPLHPIIGCSATRPSPNTVHQQSALIYSFIVNPKSRTLLATTTDLWVIVSQEIANVALAKITVVRTCEVINLSEPCRKGLVQCHRSLSHEWPQVLRTAAAR